MSVTRPLTDFFRSRGPRVVTCPETEQGAAVRIDALHAAWSGEVRLSQCTRWPERAGCAETCLSQIAASADGCLVQAIVARWYAGKSCVVCSRAIGPIVWHEAPPAVVLTDGRTSEWKDLALQDLPAILRGSRPLCWSCNNVAELQRINPAVITYRSVTAPPAPPVLKSDAVY